MDRVFLALGGLYGFLGVALGAFGAHALRARLTEADLATFQTGVSYQMYHALALLAVAWAWTRWPTGTVAAAGWAFAAGVLIFSGSLYTLVLTGHRWLGAVTPLGGLAFLVGWALLVWSALRSA
ncbi:MAG: DUF423 domain-containing protein [Longimicrobiales bacterium]